MPKNGASQPSVPKGRWLATTYWTAFRAAQSSLVFCMSLLNRPTLLATWIASVGRSNCKKKDRQKFADPFFIVSRFPFIRLLFHDRFAYYTCPCLVYQCYKVVAFGKSFNINVYLLEWKVNLYNLVFYGCNIAVGNAHSVLACRKMAQLYIHLCLCKIGEKTRHHFSFSICYHLRVIRLSERPVFIGRTGFIAGRPGAFSRTGSSGNESKFAGNGEKGSNPQRIWATVWKSFWRQANYTWPKMWSSFYNLGNPAPVQKNTLVFATLYCP